MLQIHHLAASVWQQYLHLGLTTHLINWQTHSNITPHLAYWWWTTSKTGAHLTGRWWTHYIYNTSFDWYFWAMFTDKKWERLNPNPNPQFDIHWCINSRRFTAFQCISKFLQYVRLLSEKLQNFTISASVNTKNCGLGFRQPSVCLWIQLSDTTLDWYKKQAWWNNGTEKNLSVYIHRVLKINTCIYECVYVCV